MRVHTIGHEDMSVDEVDSGMPRLTLDASSMGGPGPLTFGLTPAAVRGLVDALIGVAPPPPGEVRMVVKADLGVLLAGGLKLSLAEHEDQAYDPYLSTPRAFGLVGKTVEIVDTFLGKSEVDGGTIQVSERVGSDLVLTIERPNGTLRVVQATQNNASRHVRIVHE